MMAPLGGLRRPQLKKRHCGVPYSAPVAGALRPLRWLRDAALLFTLLSAVVHFATEGFEALVDLSIGLVAMAVLSYQVSMRLQAEVPPSADEDMVAG